MQSVTSCEYMVSERHAYLKNSGDQKFYKVYKPHPSFTSKLFELFPKSGVTHPSTRKALALHDYVCDTDGKALYLKCFTQCCDNTNWGAFVSNQSAADTAENNGPS